MKQETEAVRQGSKWWVGKESITEEEGRMREKEIQNFCIKPKEILPILLI